MYSGRIVEKYSLFLVLTLDNPITENSSEILEDIVKGKGYEHKDIENSRQKRSNP